MKKIVGIDRDINGYPIKVVEYESYDEGQGKHDLFMTISEYHCYKDAMNVAKRHIDEVKRLKNRSLWQRIRNK